MKKTTNIRILAALLMASAAIASCSVKEDIFEGETTIEEEPAKVYTLSVNATKGGDDETTKALSLDGKTLNATWAQDEEVTVYNNTKKALLSGTLTAQSSGASTTLKGSLTGTIEDGDELILRFNSASYASQSGTLEYIAANCDYAEATVTVSSVDGENNVIPTSAASFVNKQAIVKFILKDQDGNPLNVSSLTISAESNRLVSAGGLRGTGDKTYYTEYTVDAGTGNNGVNGGYDQILDGNTATKWCVSKGTKSGGVWFVEFHTSSAVQVDGYKLTTADDTQSYSGRNPKNWTLKAKANSGDAWTVIDTKTGNTDMPGANLSSVDFEADVQGGVYQYFRLEVSAVQSGDWFQLSEMQLYGCSDHAFSIQYGDVNVVPAAATNELTVALNNQNGAPDTYTLTATSGDVSYSFTKSGVTFESGKYYAITVKMTEAASPWDGSLAVEALTAGTVKVNINGTLSTGMNYSVNGGEKTLITTSTDIPVSAGDRVQFYGNGTSTQVYYKSDIKVKIQGSGTGFTCKAYGNIMSLLDETGFATKTDLPNENIFRELFRDNTTLTDAGDLLLPATTLRNYCYQDMFHGCSALTAAPALPATTLAGGCYYGMFQDCIALTTAPTLPAETLTSSCYYWMFQGCSALTAAPALPAMTLNAYCYGGMFQGCSALTAAPDLPAVTLTEGCYSYMFKDCTNLNFVRCLATSGITTPKTDQWLSGVAATGTFFRASGTEDQWTEGVSGIPSGWSSVCGHTLASAVVGEIIGSDGLAYAATDKDILPSGFAVAIVAFVGSAGSVETGTTYRGLAVAMSDANNGSGCLWVNASTGPCVSHTTDIATARGYLNGIACTETLVGSNGTGVTTNCSDHSHTAAIAARSNNGTSAPTGCSDWFLPSMGQWQLIVKGLTGKSTAISTSSSDTYKADKVNPKITAAGGTGLIGSKGYWSSTEYQTGWAWFMSFYYGYAHAIESKNWTDGTNYYVRSVLAF